MEKQQVMAIAAGLQIFIRIFLVFSHFPLVLVIFGLMPSSCKRISGPFDPPRGLPGFSLLVFSLRETQPKIVRVLDAGHTTITFAFLVFFCFWFQMHVCFKEGGSLPTMNRLRKRKLSLSRY